MIKAHRRVKPDCCVRLLFLGLVLCGTVLGSTAHAEDPFIVGVGTHLMNFEASPNRALGLAADAGIDAIKEDAFWSTAEQSQGQLQIVPQWRTYLNAAKGRNLKTLVILDYSTKFYDNAKPRAPKVKKAYLTYADYVSRQLANKINYYEVWNEWDLEGPKDRKLAADYATLVKDTVPILRKNDPNAKILAGSVTPEGMDYGFADTLIESGALDMVDGLSIHPYVHCASLGRNTPEAWVKWVRDYIRHVNEKAGKDVPIYVTEISWPSHTGNCGNSAETVAAYMARSFFLARTLPTLKGMWWYDLANDGEDRTDQEHNFGLLEHNLDPKPAYGVLKAISPIVRGFTYDPKASTLSNDVYLLYFNKGSERVVVGWAAGRAQDKQVISNNPHTGHLQLIDTALPAKGVINSDALWACTADRCSASVTLTAFPKIISLGATDVMSQR